MIQYKKQLILFPFAIWIVNFSNCINFIILHIYFEYKEQLKLNKLFYQLF